MNRNEFAFRVTEEAATLGNYAIHFTKDVDNANDLVQDTLLKALTYFNKFKDGTNLQAWLYTILKNTFINYYRRQAKIKATICQSDQISSADLYYSAQSNHVDRTFLMEDIQKAFSKLPREYYVPFTMYFEGYKYHEIADQLQIPIGTVKTRIHVARQRMQKKLSVYKQDKNNYPN